MESLPATSEFTLNPLEVTYKNIAEISQKLLGITPCQFQAASCSFQLRGEHSILISPTGSGKSLTFFLPFIWQKSGITLLICPLQLLGQQHAASHFLAKLKVHAINLTAVTATDQAFKDIENGIYQLVVASPEYIAEDARFVCLWRSKSFVSRVKRIIFDEAHCISQWGDFRKAYNNLCFLRYIIPSAVLIILSATLPPLVLAEVRSALGLSRNTALIHRSNDRSNIALVVRQMLHSIRSLHDLAFTIPLGFNSNSNPPPKFMIFMESKDLCERATQFLRLRLPKDLRHKIIWVHADMSRYHNQEALTKLRNGDLYGIVCTDVAGMGIDIPDIELVVQYQLPASLSILWQRLGRGARNVLLTAIAVLLVEKKHFRNEKARIRQNSEARMVTQRKRKHEALLKEEELARHLCITTPSTEPKSMASPGLSNTIHTKVSVPLRLTKPIPVQTRRTKSRPIDVGLEHLINSHLNNDANKQCRHGAINQYFENPTEVAESERCCDRCDLKHPPASHCCDVCSPNIPRDLFDNMDAPAKKANAPRRIKLDPPPDPLPPKYAELIARLKEWREQVVEKLYGPFFLVGGLAIIGDPQIDRIVGLAFKSLLPDVEMFRAQVDWCYHDEYDTEVLSIIHEIFPANIRSACPEPSTSPTSAQTSLPSTSDSAGLGDLERPSKRKAYRCRACGLPGHNGV